MSPSGERLRIRCRSFPGLVSACVIDWLYPWPADALQKVAEYFLQVRARAGALHSQSPISIHLHSQVLKF
jgi:hypothetical protein